MRSRRIKDGQPVMLLSRNLLLSLVLGLTALTALPAAVSAQEDSTSDNGQQITDTKGGIFMEEVIDPAEERRKEAERKRIRGIDRHLLSPEELKNVGVQMAPSGAIVPLINRDPNAPPIRRNRSVLTSETQPAWTMIPYAPNLAYPQRFPYPYSYPYSGYGRYSPYNAFGPYNRFNRFSPYNSYNPYNPYNTYNYLNPFSGFNGIGSRTTITYGDSPSPQVSQTFTMPPFPSGLPFYNRFNPGFGGLYGGARIGNSFSNFFLPGQSTYSLETTTRPLLGPISRFETDFDDDLK